MNQKLFDIQSVGKFQVIEGAKTATVPGRPGVLMRVGGVFQRADAKNANNRVYSEALWDRVLGDPAVVERIGERGMMGEADHPKEGETNIDRVSHVITALQKKSDKTIYGEAEILDTPRGRIVATLIQSGCRLGISSRGDGSVENKDGTDHVSENDFKMDTFDFVINPSTSGAYPAQLSESAVQNERRILEALEGHVNKSATQGDVKSLVEAGQIISKSFERTAHPALRDRMLNAITEHLNKNSDSNLETDCKESDMKNGQVTEQGTPPATGQTQLTEAAYHQHRMKEVEDKLTEANATIADLSRQKGELQERVDAAAKLIEEYGKQLTALNESVEAWREKSRQASRKRIGEVKESGDITEGYEAAIKLVDELLEKLVAATDELAEKTREYEAAEILLAEFIAVTEEEGVAGFIEKALVDGKGKPHPKAEQIRGVLEGCETITEVKQRLEKIKPLLSDGVAPPRPRPRSPKEPLPTASGRKVVASKTKGGKADLKVVETTGDPGKRAMVSRIVDKCGS
jgi:methyl-accepting chemotaxis protein